MEAKSPLHLKLKAFNLLEMQMKHKFVNFCYPVNCSNIPFDRIFLHLCSVSVYWSLNCNKMWVGGSEAWKARSCLWIWALEPTAYYNHFTVPMDTVWDPRVSQCQKGKTRKVKPIWIYWSSLCLCTHILADQYRRTIITALLILYIIGLMLVFRGHR